MLYGETSTVEESFAEEVVSHEVRGGPRTHQAALLSAQHEKDGETKGSLEIPSNWRGRRKRRYADIKVLLKPVPSLHLLLPL